MKHTHLASSPSVGKPQITQSFWESGWAASIKNTGERGGEHRADQKALGFPPNSSAVPHDPALHKPPEHQEEEGGAQGLSWLQQGDRGHRQRDH